MSRKGDLPHKKGKDGGNINKGGTLIFQNLVAQAEAEMASTSSRSTASLQQRDTALSFSIMDGDVKGGGMSNKVSPKSALPMITNKKSPLKSPKSPISPSNIIKVGEKNQERQSQIESRLFELGVDFSKAHFDDDLVNKTLPLFIFDDWSYDSKLEPADWVGSSPVPAVTLVNADNGGSKWIPCKVLSFDSKTNLYNIHVLEISKGKGGKAGWVSKHVPRIKLLFEAEDIEIFAKRVSNAIKVRNNAVRCIQYYLCIECMPTDDVTALSETQISRILQSSLSTKKLESSKDLNTRELLVEVNANYSRVMNSIIFGLNAKESSLLDLELPDAIPLPKVPEKGTIFIPKHNFIEQNIQFNRNSIYTKKAVVLALQKTISHCVALKSIKVFETKFDKSVRLEDFEHSQHSKLKSCKQFLQDEWSISVRRDIVASFLQDPSIDPKYDLNEDRREAFLSTPLKRFFNVVEFIIEDYFRIVLELCIKEYASFIIKSSKLINNEVDNINSKQHKPLFSVGLLVNGSTTDIVIEYSEPPAKIIATPTETLTSALISVSNLTQIERLVMEKLYWNKTPLIKTISGEESWVKSLNAEMKESLEANLPLLEAHLRLHDRFLSFLKLDTNSYINEFVTKNQQPAEGEEKKFITDHVSLANDLKLAIEKHKKAIIILEDEIPLVTNVGMVAVDAASLRRTLESKHESIIKSLLEILSTKASESMTEVSDKYQKIKNKLAATPTDIESLTQMEAYLKDIPKILEEASAEADILLKNFDLLDSFKYHQSYIDFNTKWKIVGWPKTMVEAIAKVKESNGILKISYSDEMENEQEAFREGLNRLADTVGELKSINTLDRVSTAIESVNSITKRIEQSAEKAKLFNSRESLFDKDVSDYSQIEEIKRIFEPYRLLWEAVNDWQKSYDSWMNGSFLDLDAEALTENVDKLFKNLNKSSKTFERDGLTACLAIANEIKDLVEKFKPYCPLIQALRTPGLKERHWRAISVEVTKAGTPVELMPDATFTLAEVFKLNLNIHYELISKVSETAAKEYQIELALNKMESEWESINLTIKKYGETGTFILAGIDELIALIDEQITMTQAMSFSAFKKPFEERIEKWNEGLQITSEVVEEWIKVQRSWLYLQPIFDSPDINKQLPQEGKRFQKVDKEWRKTLKAAFNNPSALAFCNNKILLDEFRESNKLLDLVQKGLSEYLETKRGSFSRFYFLSNEELLEILSETKDPTKVQPHLKKCFEAIKSVKFQKDGTITDMKSSEGEIVPFTTPVSTTNVNVEDWMNGVEEQMKASVKRVMCESILDYTKVEGGRGVWMQKWPGQCVINASQVHWTIEMEECMDRAGNAGIKENYEKQLSQLDVMVSLVRGKLEDLARISIGALAVIDVHARDVTKKMLDDKVGDRNDFQWISQLRYYWEGEGLDGDMWAMMVSSKRPYGYEYLGNSFRLVITPLTDKCYMTLMGALQVFLGGAPAGPAGTGKTETTKDLAKALAKQCIVFNCSDSMDYKMTGKFFKGLASCGAWACFDEFNRILVEVLSVIAQQILSLQQAVIAKKERVIFEDTEIRVSDQFAVFITMNPGYAGRTELPDNLKALFRPVAMMVPDYCLIGEIMLFAYGFTYARMCAQKMVATFKLCSEQLSSQDHYDYGMRAVKTVIVAAGNLKRGEPDQDEDLLMLRGLMDVNLPKFLSHDLPLFRGIMGDLFPGKRKQEIDYGDLLRCLKVSCENKNLQPVPAFIEKCIQLYEMIVVRHGLMVVGPTGGGKTSNIRVLCSALTQLRKEKIKGPRYEATEIYYINPKSITMGQLYGQFDVNTHEWCDGVLAKMIRECSSSQTKDLKWMLFDGPVDTLWIESMNTVLDDNKKLCLNSGEIVALSNEVTMMFEPRDLSVASPATVSRCGMIYMEPKTIGFDPVIQSWMETLPKIFSKVELRPKLRGLFDTYLIGALYFLRRNLTEPLISVDNNLNASLMRLLDCFFEPFMEKEGREPPSAKALNDLAKTLPAVFMFCFVWSVCSTVNTNGRKRFDSYMRAEMAQNGFAYPFPASGQIYDFCWSTTTNQWMPWLETAPEYKHNPKLGFDELVIPTQDTIRYTFVLNQLLLNGKGVMMTGPTGTGKSVNINNHLQTGMTDTFIPLCFTFSAQTSANQTQDIIDGKTEKRRKGVYGPPAGKQFIIFVDDVNMPMREIFFAQPPIELLRQLLEVQGWFDRTTREWRSIIDWTMVIACGPPGGGRNPMCERFTRYFNIINYTEMNDESMYNIFYTILSNFTKNFAEPIQKVAKESTLAAIAVYNETLLGLLPTPAKSHYTFNLRDLSKIFQGLLMADKKTVTTDISFARLWVHENRRVFQDRMINQEDVNWFDQLLKQQVEEKMKFTWDKVVPNSRLFFGDYMIPGADPKIYAEVQDLTKLVPIMEEYLVDHNTERKPTMNLVLFTDAVEHISRICRVIRQPSGNALLLGVGGSGRQSLTRLATFIADYDLFQVQIAKGYGKAEWKENLKTCLLKAGIKNVPVVLLMTDTQIVFEGMLEDINSVLNSGDVPNLYSPEDEDSIITTCRTDCQKKGLPPTKLNIFAQYILRVKRNIHVVFCMSPNGEPCRRRLRMFPSLSNCCTIDWFTDWPDEALKNVATSALVDPAIQLEPSVLEGAVNFVKFLHQSVARSSADYFSQLRRYNYVTPTSYLEILSTYKGVFLNKKAEIGITKDRLTVGLNKMALAEGDVAGLQAKITEMQPILVRTQKEVNEMIIQITKDKEDAAVTKAIVEKEEEVANEKARATKLIADDAQKDLDEALPALEEAVQCLSELKKEHIDEVKSMGKPPAGVVLTMEATCILFKIAPKKINDPDKVGAKLNDYMGPAKSELLSDPKHMLKSLVDFDKDGIEEKTIKQLTPYMNNENFTVDKVEKASVACRAICMWARAMYKYYFVAREVEPKKLKLAEAQASLDITIAALNKAKAQLEAVNANITSLESKLHENVVKKEELAAEVELCSGRLARAEILLGGLGGEKKRWTETVGKLTVAYTNVAGDALVSSGTIAYLGAFTPEFRKSLVDKWLEELVRLKMPHTSGCTIGSTLADPVKVRQWTIAGLPTDNHSKENGIVMSIARRWPLLIDPQGQANRFVKNMGKDKSFAESGIDIIKLTDDNYLRSLENGIRLGRWILLENIGEELDAALEPLLTKQLFKQGGQLMIKLGDNNIPWNDSFKFFMSTKLPNPHYAPEVCVKVTLLNFTITPGGLEDQLLGIVIIEERPDLEEQKNIIILSNAEMKKQLVEIEMKILYNLSNSTGNILDDVELIETLANAKKTSDEINIKVAEAEKTEMVIDETREKYRPVAFRGSLLYFCIADLSYADPMYQYSLQWFNQLFTFSIRNAEASSDIEKRLMNLVKFFTKSLYNNVCRSLFEKHKLMFSLLLCVKIMDGDKRLDAEDWRFFISGITPEAAVESTNPDPSWIVERSWKEICALSTISHFDGFLISFKKDIAKWRDYFDDESPQNAILPSPWNEKLNDLQKLCILRALRLDKINEGIQLFVIHEMGQAFVEPPPFDLRQCFEDASAMTPLIFVLTAGTDPTRLFYDFAKKLDMEATGLSLGQGQDVIAQKMITEGVKKGTWVYLQNCHLYVSWMSELEKLVEKIDPETVNPNFRLWLSSMPSGGFPVSILQNGVKMTMEPPKGLRSNLKNTYYNMDEADLEKTTKPTQYKKLLFALSFFHANVQDRRKYGALGWNRPYDFNDTDLEISKSQVQLYLDMYDEIPFKVLNILVSYINYGGRVTDYIDLRTIDVLLRELFCPQVMQDGYSFSKSGIYHSVPVDPENPLKGYMKYIDSLPINPEPEVFGMHQNAAITSAQNEVYELFTTVLGLQPRSSSGKGASREDLLFDLATSIEERMPSLFDVEAVGMRWPILYEQSMNTVLLQELLRYNPLIEVINSTLPQLKKALRGLVVMSGELEEMSNSLFNQWVPKMWESKAYPSLKPLGAWVTELLDRLNFIQRWIDNGTPAVYWITGFYFPQAFFTGTLQNYARKYKLPIDTIEFDLKVNETPWGEIKSAPADGCLIRGIYLEGARWNAEIGSLDDSRPKELYTELSVLHMIPVQHKKAPTSGVYKLPVYKILSRWGVLATTGHSSNHVMWLDLPSKRNNFINNADQADDDTWIKAGVAGFCSLRY